MDSSFKKISKSLRTTGHKTDYNKQKICPRAFHKKSPVELLIPQGLIFKISTVENSLKLG
jgi:hypothetical protein